MQKAKFFFIPFRGSWPVSSVTPQNPPMYVQTKKYLDLKIMKTEKQNQEFYIILQSG